MKENALRIYKDQDYVVEVSNTKEPLQRIGDSIREAMEGFLDYYESGGNV